MVASKEPCGIQEKYRKAKIFTYESGNPAPIAEHAACYDVVQERVAAPNVIKVFESDGDNNRKVDIGDFYCRGV
jgi:hypothetical protein